MLFYKKEEKLKHGDKMNCPTCKAPGRKDGMKGKMVNNRAEFEDAVFVNSYTGLWECYDCWLKS